MTITLTREEAADVLYALADAAGCVQQNYQPGHLGHGWNKEIELLRARLAQPEPEKKKYTEESCPVCGYYCLGKGGVYCIDKPKLCGINTAPPQREWQGLTDDEREKATGWSVEHIEDKLKEKNS